MSAVETKTALLAAADEARILSVPPRTAYERMRLMPHVQMGRSIRVTAEALERYIASCSIDASDPTARRVTSTGRGSSFPGFSCIPALQGVRGVRPKCRCAVQKRYTGVGP